MPELEKQGAATDQSRLSATIECLLLAISGRESDVHPTASIHPIADIPAHAKSVYGSLVASKAALVLNGVLTRIVYDHFWRELACWLDCDVALGALAKNRRC